ncbi:MAG: four helix bundle protein [Candidatus Omnitrophica bacterium]|nr:four helix bundle protein [Candidatus Omnitrophota bacterium]
MQHSFEGLKVWQKGMDLVREVYKASQSFPKEERYGLTSQLRRAAISIPLNIAEGKGRYHKKEYVQFLYTARGSIYEVMTLLYLSKDLLYLTQPQAEALLNACTEITAMLSGLIQSLH